MNSYMLSPATHDLDGLTFPTNQHEIPHIKREDGFNPDFGFDPSLTEQNMFDRHTDSSHDSANLNGLGSRGIPQQNPQDIFVGKYNSAHRPSLSLPHIQQQSATLPYSLMNRGMGALPGNSLSLNTANLPNTTSTTSIYGQVTPPRSDSATSQPSKNRRDPTSANSDPSTTKRRRGKAQAKDPLTPPDDNDVPQTRKASGRKRTSIAHLSTGNPEDDKRKASLEKNRVAAAKCRVNKKEKTEQLQRDSHSKAQENGQLRGLVDTMELERNTLAAYLSAHASCADCRNPHRLKEALQMFQEKEMRKHLSGLVGKAARADASPVLSASGHSTVSGLYDDSDLASISAMNPPLPDFSLGGDYDMDSPLPT